MARPKKVIVTEETVAKPVEVKKQTPVIKTTAGFDPNLPESKQRSLR
jgi:hypothetical protein